MIKKKNQIESSENMNSEEISNNNIDEDTSIEDYIKQKRVALSELEYTIDQKTKKILELDLEIEKRDTKLSKMSVLIEIEKEKLIKLRDKSSKKQDELKNLSNDMLEKNDKMGDTVVEFSPENLRDLNEKGYHLDEMELRFLFREIDSYIDNAYLHSGIAYKKRIDSIKDIESVTLDFFRTKDRIDNGILIFQYLIFFGRDVEFSKIKIGDLTNHYKQFKEAMINFFSFLYEDDVKEAIYREMKKKPNELKDKNGGFEKKIKEMQEMIKNSVAKMDKVSIQNFFELFELLRKFMLFWFEIRAFDIKRIRKSDIYIYYLLKHLLSLNR